MSVGTLHDIPSSSHIAERSYLSRGYPRSKDWGKIARGRGPPMARGRGQRRRQARGTAASAASVPAAARPADAIGRWSRALVVAAAVIAFGGSLRNQFTYDEGLVIGEADGVLR